MLPPPETRRTRACAQLVTVLLAGFCAWPGAYAQETTSVATRVATAQDAGVEAAEGQEATETPPALVEGAEAQTDTLTIVQVGLYVMRISEVSQHDGRWVLDAWVWFRWQGTEALPYETFEIVNGSIDMREPNDVIEDQGYNYSAVRIRATIFHVFDVERFPFDDHVLSIEIEDNNLEDANLQFVVDEGIAIDPEVEVEGFQVRLLPARAERHTYPTVYGYRSLAATTSSYSRFTVPIELRRGDKAPLFKLFWVSYLAVILSLLALRVRPTDLDARFGLGTGSIFAASANAFVVNEQLPTTVDLTIAEQVNLLAVGCIFLSVFVSVASLRLCYRDRVELSEKLDKFALVVLATTYVVANLLVVKLQS